MNNCLRDDLIWHIMTLCTEEKRNFINGGVMVYNFVQSKEIRLVW